MAFRFTKELHDALKCLICHEVLTDPRMCPEGHSFCAICITTWLDMKGECPIDRVDRSIEDFAIARPLVDLIDELNLLCTNYTSPKKVSGKRKKEGSSVICCEWTGQKKMLERHLKNDCPFTDIDCKYAYLGCGEKMKRGETELHFKAFAFEHCEMMQTELSELKKSKKEKSSKKSGSSSSSSSSTRRFVKVISARPGREGEWTVLYENSNVLYAETMDSSTELFSSTRMIDDFSWDPPGQCVVYCNATSVDFYDFSSKVDTFSNETNVSKVRWNPTNQLIATRRKEDFEVDKIQIFIKRWLGMEWCTTSFRMVRHDDEDLLMEWAPNGEHLLLCNSRVVAVLSEAVVLEIKFSYRNLFNSVAWKPDSTGLVSTTADSKMIFWDLEANRLKEIEMESAASSVQFCPNGTTLATSQNGQVCLWDDKVRNFARFSLPFDVKAIQFSSDSEVVTALGQTLKSISKMNFQFRHEIS